MMGASGLMTLSMLLEKNCGSFRINGIYDAARFKLYECLLADIGHALLEIPKQQSRLSVGTWNVISINMEKLSAMKDKLNQLPLRHQGNEME